MEISLVSGAGSGDSGTTFFGSAGATLGAAAGAAIGGRVGVPPAAGAAIGSGLGAVGGEAAYNAVKNAANSWNPSAFHGTSFFPQVPGGMGS